MIRRLALAALLSLPVALPAQSTAELERRRMQFATRVPDGVIVVLGGREPAEDYLTFHPSPS